MQSITKILNDRDKILLEKAIKFYFFARQIDAKRLQKEVYERLYYAGSVAYSLIITFVKTDSLNIEYMDFLNKELKHMLSVPNEIYDHLQIKPGEIDEIELMRETLLSFYDEDEQVNIRLIYRPESNQLELQNSRA